MGKATVAGLDRLLTPGITERRIDTHILSVLRADEPGAPYDRRASTYDRLVRSRLYNGLLWSTRPADYSAFALEAIGDARGPMLEVACGSATFTAPAYRATARSSILVDRSAAMLERAASRLVDGDGALPGHLTLLQADLDALPFQPSRFDTVLFMGALHLLEDVAGTVQRLARQCAPGGRLFASGLVAETAVGGRYLRLLHRAGEVAAPRSEDELRDLFRSGLQGPAQAWRRIGSMVYAKAQVT